MNLRRRFFYNNAKMVIIIVLCLLLFIGIFALFFVKILQPAITNYWQTGVMTFEIVSMLDDFDTNQITDDDYLDDVNSELQQKDFHLIIFKNGAAHYGSITESDALLDDSVLEYFENHPGSVVVFKMDNISSVCKSVDVDGDSYAVLAVTDSDTVGVFSSGLLESRELAWVVGAFLTEIVVLVIIAVIVVILFSRINEKNIDIPLRKLSNVAEKISDGDFSTRIEYTGIKEFEEICDATNAMQDKIVANISRMQEYEKSRTEMFAGISHDLKTPLTSVIGYVKGLMDGIANTPEKQKKYYEIIYKKSMTMSLLLDRLLLVTRLEANEDVFNMETVNVKLFFEHCRDDIMDMQDNTDVSFSFECDDDAYICADVIQLSRVFTNIVENSRVHAHADNLAIHMDIKQAEDKLYVSIKDNGAGTPEDEIPHLFEMFYRADKSRTDPGSGIGLAMSKLIVEAHGGTIEARNNGGFEIMIILPIQKGDKNGKNLDS
ncbi:MAG: HAMP domain-containing histidine kinase [Clostridiales bacterium]|nr:HAMP domain-containing histidine kinase [Clostridiales bacterium]